MAALGLLTACAAYDWNSQHMPLDKNWFVRVLLDELNFWYLICGVYLHNHAAASACSASAFAIACVFAVVWL